MKIAIIGGGISGLSTALYIKQARPEVELHIFESKPNLGGTMATRDIDGFRFEIGSNGFLSNKPDTLDLVHAAGADDLLLRSSDDSRIRFIFHDGELQRLPESPPLFLKSRLLTVGGKLRVAMEPFIRAKRDDADETLQSFGYRRVGRQFTDVFLDAMSAGIYGNTPPMLSVNAAFPMVVALEREYGGLFKGMLKKKKKEAGPGGVLMSFKGGVGSFVEHLRNIIDAEFHIGNGVDRIESVNGRYRLRHGNAALDVDRVVLSTPAYAAADITADFDTALSAELAGIDYTPISVVGFGWNDLPHPLHGFGLLTTGASRQEVLGVLWDSSVFDDRAPDGRKMVRIMIGGQRQPELALQSDEDLISTGLRGLKSTMGIDTPPDVRFVQRWERGIPNYRVGHMARVARIRALAAQHPGLYLNSNAYDGIGINDCVRNSRLAAERLVAEL
ncbi:MAG: protoporphyrinogen oxidase [Chromatiales bacterium]|nr:protoporphyrinogen oxidase [Gammaproteobacteria bacterium]MCP5353054.1 protoporphyrinogen oxidase [Chromatiales bacterium]